MSTAARPAFEIAILGATYDGDIARRLADRLRRRLADPARLWTRTPDGENSLTNEDACGDARTVVVLLDRLWGRTSSTLDDLSAVQTRAKSDAASVLFVSLDGSTAPAWARKAKSVDVRTATIDECVDTIIASVRRSGGDVRDERAEEITEREAVQEKRTRDRDSYLGSHRSGPACTRELERLADEVIALVETLRDDVAGEIAVTRGVGRSILQLGTLALTLSWIRSRTDAVIEGRLMIMEWDGTVRRGNENVPERAPSRAVAPPPALLHEETFVADTATEQEWRWRREGHALGTYTSSDLAARCVASIAARLAERAVAKASA
jgi:hypothetical protein